MRREPLKFGPKPKVAKKVQVYNNTLTSACPVTEEQIAKLPVLGLTISKWRERNIMLYAHPSNPERLISVGTTFCGSMVVISDEERNSWATALDYLAHGKVYTSE